MEDTLIEIVSSIQDNLSLTGEERDKELKKVIEDKREQSLSLDKACSDNESDKESFEQQHHNLYRGYSLNILYPFPLDENFQKYAIDLEKNIGKSELQFGNLMLKGSITGPLSQLFCGSIFYGLSKIIASNNGLLDRRKFIKNFGLTIGFFTGLGTFSGSMMGLAASERKYNNLKKMGKNAIDLDKVIGRLYQHQTPNYGKIFGAWSNRFYGK